MKRTEERTEKGPFFQVHPNPPPVKPNSGAKGIKVLTQTCSQGQLKALRHSTKGSGSEEKYYHGKARQESCLGHQETWHPAAGHQGCSAHPRAPDAALVPLSEVGPAG